MKMWQVKERAERERGQSLVEMAVITPFLLILLIAAIELSQAFVVYVALINSAREGAVYASLYPELSNASSTPAESARYTTYIQRIKAETVALGLDQDRLQPLRPIAPQGLLANCPITTSVSYQLSTFTSNISLPYFGRMGLPSTYVISYSVGMPIRYANSQGCLPP